jgi:hypothetical protein
MWHNVPFYWPETAGDLGRSRYPFACKKLFSAVDDNFQKEIYK